MNLRLSTALIAACFCLPAAAQTNIQIYGIADAGLVKTSESSLRVASGVADGSRLGFKGTEDLGGGFKAIFNLEARIELDTGTQQPTLINDNQGYYLTKGMDALPAPVLKGIRTAIQQPGAPSVNVERALFDRTAMVGLITPGGAFLLGRMYTPGYEIFAMSDVFESGTAGTWGGITGGTAGFTALGADIRSQRSIQYRAVTPSGWNVAAMYGTKGSGYLGRYNKFIGANVAYKANGIEIGYGFNRGYDQNDQQSLTTHTLGGSVRVNDNWKLFAGYHDQKNLHSVLLKDYTAGWDAAIAPLLAPLGAPTASALRKLFITNIDRNAQEDASSYQVGLHYIVGPGRVMASVAHQNDRTPSNSDATQYALGYDYNLSKRTDVYLVAAVIKNNNDAQYVPGTAGSPGGFAKVPGTTTHGYNIGIRHRF